MRVAYSVEQKQRAIELYVRYGLKATAVVRELGYPDRNTLVRWYRHWKDDPEGLKPSAFTLDQKVDAVDHYLTHGKNLSFTMRELGYPGSNGLLASWIDELAPEERRTSKPKAMPARDEICPVGEKEPKDEGLLPKRPAEKEGITAATLHRWKRELSSSEAAEVREVPKEDRTGRPEDIQKDIDALEEKKAALEAELKQLELRRDIMEGTLELLGKGMGAVPENELTNREKTILIESLRPRWKLAELLAALDIARSSYQYQLGALRAPDKDAELRKKVREVFEASDKTYGRRRVYDELKVAKMDVGEHRIGRIMAEEGLMARGSTKPKKGYSSYAGEVSRHPGNLVRRDFAAALPNLLWLTDVTQFSIPAGRLYLSPILDCFDGAIVSWTISRSPNAEMANSMLKMALSTTAPKERAYLIIHSDCGCHYRWPEWIAICEKAGIRRSMSKKGCSPDNSRMEGFFGTMKVEMFYGKDWSEASLDDLEKAINDYIEWHNATRIKRSLGSMSPLAYRKSLGLAA